jgi:hypothetical protein
LVLLIQQSYQNLVFPKGGGEWTKTFKISLTRILIRVFNFNRKFPSGSIFVLKAFQRNKIQSNNLDIFPLFVKGGGGKIGLVLFQVIPAKAGIQCFHGAANTLDPGFHRGDEYSVIFTLVGDPGGFTNQPISPIILSHRGEKGTFLKGGRLSYGDKKRISRSCDEDG